MAKTTRSNCDLTNPKMIPELHDYDDNNKEAAATAAVEDDATDGATA